MSSSSRAKTRISVSDSALSKIRTAFYWSLFSLSDRQCSLADHRRKGVNAGPERNLRFLIQINDIQPSEQEKLRRLELDQVYFDCAMDRAFAVVRASGPGQAIGYLHQSLNGVSTILLSHLQP